MPLDGHEIFGGALGTPQEGFQILGVEAEDAAAPVLFDAAAAVDYVLESLGLNVSADGVIEIPQEPQSGLVDSRGPGIRKAGDPDTGWGFYGGMSTFRAGGSQIFGVGQAYAVKGAMICGSGVLCWTGNSVLNNTMGGDLQQARDGSDILAQRRGANPQEHRWYNMHENGGVDFERGFARWSSDVWEVGTEAGGTGTARPLALDNADIRTPNLPTSDPGVAGKWWADNGAIKISAG